MLEHPRIHRSTVDAMLVFSSLACNFWWEKGYQDTAVRGHTREGVVNRTNAAVVQRSGSVPVVDLTIGEVHSVGIVYIGKASRFTRLE